MSKVSGFKALSRNLRSMAQIMQRPVNEASRKALAPILKDAKANLRANGSVVTGQLLKGMVIRQKAKRRNQIINAVTASGQAPCANSPARPVAVQIRTVRPTRKPSSATSRPSGMPPPSRRSPRPSPCRSPRRSTATAVPSRTVRAVLYRPAPYVRGLV